jgi:hypothetical protein
MMDHSKTMSGKIILGRCKTLPLFNQGKIVNKKLQRPTKVIIDDNKATIIACEGKNTLVSNISKKQNTFEEKKIIEQPIEENKQIISDDDSTKENKQILDELPLPVNLIRYNSMDDQNLLVDEPSILFVDRVFTITCPWCEYTAQVLPNQINCKIFRCGNFKHNNEPINPHLPKDQCDDLVNKNLIYGCGKPFWFDGIVLKTCDYI